ncbi:hypothetical protein [Actinophytocola sediminis]
MKTDLPDRSVWLMIPENCRVSGGFTNNRDIRVVFGDPADETTVVFERFALERFARLAHELLAVPAYDEDPAHLPVIVSPQAPENPGVPNLAAGRDSTFIHELRNVSGLLNSYRRWVLDPAPPNVVSFPFADQMLLSVRLAALGHAVRELAYSRTKD